jgi:hypothetical protein
MCDDEEDDDPGVPSEWLIEEIKKRFAFKDDVDGTNALLVLQRLFEVYDNLFFWNLALRHVLSILPCPECRKLFAVDGGPECRAHIAVQLVMQGVVNSQGEGAHLN